MLEAVLSSLVLSSALCFIRWSSFQADSDEEAEAKSGAVAINLPSEKNFGGFAEQHVDPEEHKHPPNIVIEHQLTATCSDYQAAAIRDGISFR